MRVCFSVLMQQNSSVTLGGVPSGQSVAQLALRRPLMHFSAGVAQSAAAAGCKSLAGLCQTIGRLGFYFNDSLNLGLLISSRMRHDADEIIPTVILSPDLLRVHDAVKSHIYIYIDLGFFVF